MTLAAAPGAVGACEHCRLPIPSSILARSPRFCCAGCEAVWHMLHQCGLQDYYRLQKESGFAGNRPVADASLAYLDHDEFQRRHVQQLAGGRRRAELRLDGLKCGACLWLLEALPRLHPGLIAARVDMGRSIIALDWDPQRTSLSEIARRITSLGYQARPIGTLASRDEWRRQDRRWLAHIAVAGAISGNVMAIAFALYGAQFTWMDDATRQFLQWISAGLAAVAVLWPGKIFLTNAISAVRTRRPHMDLPISLALAAGLLGGIAMTLDNRPGVYFESVSMLVFLLLCGRFVQFRQQRSARHDLELICSLVPQSARRVVVEGAGQAKIEEIPTEALRPGDMVEVAAGESVCTDGILLDAAAHFDMQLLTGESRPVRVQSGGQVFAGVRLLDSHPVRMRVTTCGADTRAAGIARMVDEAAGRRPRVVEFADRIAGWFLLTVVVAAAIVGAAWWIIDPGRALPVVIAMLVVTCPCALGLATPLTMVASLGKAARAGILVRGGDVFERLAASGTIVLDKTGTVTEGRMSVLGQWGDLEAIRMAAALEARSSHPIARAITRLVGAAAEAGRMDPPVSDIREVPGGGIVGIVAGHRVRIGNRQFVAAVDSRVAVAAIDAHKSSIRRTREDCEVLDRADSMLGAGLSPVFISVDEQLRAVLGMGDPLRGDAADLARGLTGRGWEIWLASGDASSIARGIGSALNIPPQQVRGECTPERKMEIVSAIRARPIVMVGDGVNDLPAMAAADVGIAVRQGARAALEHADVALAGGGLGQVAALLDGARRTMRTIHVNFGISLAYNLVGGALAATGLINPLIAAVLMPLSGLTVTAVALRMPRFAANQSAGGIGGRP